DEFRRTGYAVVRPRSPAAKAACSSGKAPLLERSALLLHVCADEIDCLFDRRDLFRFFVGNLGLKLLLEGHHELDRVERIGAKIIDERRFILDLGFIDAKLLGDDFLDPLFNVFHASPPPRGSKTDRFYQITGVRQRHAAADESRFICRQVISMPPLTCSVAPVMYAARGLARNATAYATSSGVPRRPNGIRDNNASRCASGSARVMSVSMKPGETQLTVMLRLPTSCASDLVKPTIAAFAAA